MPINSILSQPATDSIYASYRPIVFTVNASNTDLSAVPPVVYCDIYFGGVYYKTISKTQYSLLHDGDTDWVFDIQDACQEKIDKYIAPNGSDDMINVIEAIKSVFCRFRSSGYDSNGFILSEDAVPIQGTGSTPPVSGTGTQSNTLFVINATIQHGENQSLLTHLRSLPAVDGSWDDNTYPLTRRSEYGVRICIGDSDFFAILSQTEPSCIDVFVTNKDGSFFTTACLGELVDSSGTDIPPGGCIAVGIGGYTIPTDATVGEAISISIPLTGDAPFVISDVFSIPPGLSAAIVGSNLVISGAPTFSGNQQIDIIVSNCDGSETAEFNDTLSIAEAINGTHWGSASELEGDSTHVLESIPIIGQPDEDILITCIDYNNDWGATILFNGSGVTTVGNTFAVTLDGTGNILLTASITAAGIIGHPYGISAMFEITTASGGSIGTPNDYQISKAFSS